MELEPFVFRHGGLLIGSRDAGPSTSPGRARDEEDADEQELLGAVNRFALRTLARGDFAAFTMDLCHNGVDRHFSRFPDEELEKVNAMTPGRPLMERHDLRGSLPRGTFFRSQLHRDGERLSVRPDVYVLRTQENADFILNIEGGVYRETSIGFSFQLPECAICGKDIRTCDHVPGRSYGEKTCHFVMRNVLEVIEGSVVPAGSQGTRFVAGERGAPETAVVALERARRAYHEPIEVNTHEPILSTHCARALESLARERGVDAEALPGLACDGLLARDRAIARFCGLGAELDGSAFDAGVWRQTLAGLGLDAIHRHLRAYEVRFDAKYPPQPVSRPEALPEDGAEAAGAARVMRLLEE